jgi:hypothetical protein
MLKHVVTKVKQVYNLADVDAEEYTDHVSDLTRYKTDTVVHTIFLVISDTGL